MKHLPVNNITTITADYQDGNFPVANLLDDKPKRRWSAGGLVRNATLTINVSKGASDVAIFGTNAKIATATALDPNQTSWMSGAAWQTGVEWGNSEIPALPITIATFDKAKALWIDLGMTILRPCIIKVNLSSPGNETLYAGVVVSSVAEVYAGANFRYGLGEGRTDKSIIAENSNGCRYYKKRDILRNFQGNVLMLTTEYHKLIGFFDEVGAIPTAWKLLDETGPEWLIYGISTLNGGHDYKVYTTVSIQISEVA